MTKQRTYTEDDITRALSRMRTNWRESAGLLMKLDVAASALYDPDLDDGAKRVLGVLLKMASLEAGHVVVERETIAAMTGQAVGTVANKLTRLRLAGYVESAVFGKGQGAGTQAVYAIKGFSKEEAEAYTSALEGVYGSMNPVPTSSEKRPNGHPAQREKQTFEQCSESDNRENRPNGRHAQREKEKNRCNGRHAEREKQTKRPNGRHAQRENGFDFGDDSRARSYPKKEIEKKYTKKQKQARSASDVPSDVRAAFEEFWVHYPAKAGRKGGKTPSLLTFWDITTGDFVSNPASGEPVKYAAVDAQKLVDCAKCFARAVKPEDRQFVPGVMVWFNAGKWESYLDWESPEKAKFIWSINRATQRPMKVFVDENGNPLSKGRSLR